MDYGGVAFGRGLCVCDGSCNASRCKRRAHAARHKIHRIRARSNCACGQDLRAARPRLADKAAAESFRWVRANAAMGRRQRRADGEVRPAFDRVGARARRRIDSLGRRWLLRDSKRREADDGKRAHAAFDGRIARPALASCGRRKPSGSHRFARALRSRPARRTRDARTPANFASRRKREAKKKGLGVAAKSLLFIGGPSRIRTLDLLIKSQLLYQLS